jgi:hypothetical protein
MGAIGDEAEKALSRHIDGGIEDRSDDRQVGEMGATECRVIRQRNVSPFPLENGANRPHAKTERTQVNRNVRSVHYESTLAIQEGAREVQPLLDVDRDCRASQSLPHLGHQ